MDRAGRESIIIGSAIFAMFFGAGNLIFPPFLGMQSGVDWPIGLICFVLVDVVLACAGIYGMNASGGALVAIESALGRRAGIVLATVGVLLIGAFIAMPRTAATTYDLGIAPLFGEQVGLLPFSLVFFALVFLMTYKESRVLDLIGKVLTPLLVVGVGVIVVMGIVHPIGPVGQPLTASAAQDGIRAGYQTMDILGVIGFSIIVQDTVRARGYADRSTRTAIVGRAMVIAAVLLALIYGGLAYLGATAQGLGTDLTQGGLIIAITRQLLGDAGVTMFGAVVALACLTTAVGLISSTASYFQRLTHGRLSYLAAVIVDCALGVLICNLGLDNIIAFAEPVLAVVCPAFMVTIVLMLFRRRIRSSWVYRGAALGATAAAAIIAIHTYSGVLPFVGELPLYSVDFAWLPFAVIGGILGGAAAAVHRARNPRRTAFRAAEEPVTRFYPKPHAPAHVRSHAHMSVYALEHAMLFEGKKGESPAAA